MPTKKAIPSGKEQESSGLFEALNKLKGQTGAIDPDELDARLLWKVVIILFHRGASIQVGVTKDNSAWAVQYWDGKFPVKEYFRSTEEFNRSLAAIVRVDGGKELSEEWDEIVRSYGW